MRYPLWFLNQMSQDAGEFDDWQEELETAPTDTDEPPDKHNPPQQYQPEILPTPDND